MCVFASVVILYKCVCLCVGLSPAQKFPFIFLHNFFPRFLESPLLGGSFPCPRPRPRIYPIPLLSFQFGSMLALSVGRWQRCRRRSIWIAPAEKPTATLPPPMQPNFFFLCVRGIFFRFFTIFVFVFPFFLSSLSCWRCCCCCGRCLFFSKLPPVCMCVSGAAAAAATDDDVVVVCVDRRRPLVSQAHSHSHPPPYPSTPTQILSLLLLRFEKLQWC